MIHYTSVFELLMTLFEIYLYVIHRVIARFIEAPSLVDLAITLI